MDISDYNARVVIELSDKYSTNTIIFKFDPTCEILGYKNLQLSFSINGNRVEIWENKLGNGLKIDPQLCTITAKCKPEFLGFFGGRGSWNFILHKSSEGKYWYLERNELIKTSDFMEIAEIEEEDETESEIISVEPTVKEETKIPSEREVNMRTDRDIAIDYLTKITDALILKGEFEKLSALALAKRTIAEFEE